MKRSTGHPRISTIARLRAVGAAVVFAVATFAVDAAPVALPGPIGQALGPEPALAGYCASNPNFTGRLTASSGSTTAVGRTTSPTVYGYVSNVAATWSCTAYFRYSGIAWNTAPTTGTFQWGNLINSGSVACNFAVGSTDYVKGNATSDCPDSDAEYALSANLGVEGVYQRDAAHNGVGDFSYVHADCASYYGAAPVKTGQSFSTGITGNRPEPNNCDPITIDDTATSQTITLDWTGPTLGFTGATQTGAYSNATSFAVGFSATDNVAGLDASHTWTVARSIAPVANNVCGTFVADTAGGSTVSGTTTGSQSNTQSLAAGKCYQWSINGIDANGNVGLPAPSGVRIVDTVAPTTDFTTPNESTTTTINATSYQVGWIETEAHSGVQTRSLQRRVAPLSGGNCGMYANDGSTVTGTSTVTSSGLVDAKCYQWIQTLTDRAGNTTSKTSGTVKVDLASPSANFSTPDEGTTVRQTATTYTVAWTETAGSGTISSRSLQRYRVAVGTVPNTCAGLTFVDDPTEGNLTNVTPVTASSLLSGYCYRWVQTLTNSNGKSGATISGNVLVDTTAPVSGTEATIAYPEANRPLAGDVVVTGVANDPQSFASYTLEYGAGATPGSWTTIGTFPTPVVSTGSLTTWSTGSLSGIYTLRLTVTNGTGAQTQVSRLVYLENGRRGDEAFQTRVPFELGGDWNLDVGVANGEARLSRDLFSIPSYGPAQALDLTYSSLEAGTSGKFGVGWSSNLTQYLTFDNTTYATDKFIVWHRPDGGIVPFGLVGSTWTALRGHFETLTHSGTETTITLKDQTRYVFEDASAGRLKRIENRFSKALTLVWNTSSATATDASGRATTLAIDSVNNRITGATDSAGRAWSFAYTGTDLTSITDPASKVTTLAYDGSHHLTSVVRTRSRVSGGAETITWAVGYTAGKATSVTDPVEVAGGAPDSNQFTYNAGSTDFDRLISKYDVSADRSTTRYAYDSLGRVTVETDPAGFTTTRVFDSDGNVTQEDRQVGGSAAATATSTFDTRGNPLTVTIDTDASNTATTAYSYSAANDVLTKSEADNDPSVKLVTKYAFDGSGHLTSVDANCTTSGTTPPATASTCTGAGTQDSATNLTTTYTYTTNDQVDTATDPLGRVTKHQYDGSGNETSTTANYVAGQSATVERNVVTSSAYDPLTAAGKAGLPTSTTDPVGTTTTFTYDGLGRRLTESVPGDASVPALTRTSVYDELGNELTSTESWTPIGGGALVSRTTTKTYDLANRLTVSVDPSGTQTNTVFAASGVATDSVADGVVTATSYDDRLLATTVVEGGDGSGDQQTSTTFGQYDGLGKPETTASGGVDTTTTYDYAGHELTSATQAGGGTLDTAHAYDLLGHETSVTDEAGTTIQTYDRAGRLVSVQAPAGTTTYTYDRAGNQLTSTDPAGIVTTTSFDALDRPTATIVNDVASPTLPSQDVTSRTWYDAAGTIVATTDPIGVTSRSIANVRGLAKQTILNCTDSGTTPTPSPATCVGGGTHDDTTNVITNSTFDGAGSVVVSATGVGTGEDALTETAFDGAGRVAAVKDARGTISRSFYTDGLLMRRVVNCTTTGTTIPSDWANCTGAGANDGTYNLTTTYVYDDRGNVVAETAPNGRLTTSVYDAGNRLKERIENDVTTPSGATEDVTTRYFYDDAGRQIAVESPGDTSAASHVTHVVYDDAGRVVTEIQNCIIDPLVGGPGDCVGTDQTLGADKNVTRSYAYDSRGNRVKAVEPSPSATGTASTAVVTRFAFDSGNRLCRVVENSTQDDATWNALPNKCTGTSGSSTTDVSTRYTYDGAGNLATMVDANGGTTTYGYDAAGRMTSTTDPLGQIVSYAYDALGQRVGQTGRGDATPTSATVAWTYDGAGRVMSRTAETAPSLDATAPTQATGLTATPGVSWIDLAWAPATDAVGVRAYTISRGAVYLTQVSGSVTAFRDTGLAAGTTYTYTVSAVDAAGNSSATSSPANATTPTVSPYPVQVLADGPSAYWRLGETSGAFVDSAVGNDAAAVGSPTRGVANPSLATNDGAVSMASVSNYLTAPDSADLDLGDGPFSIELWFRRDTDTGTTTALLNKGSSGYLVDITAADEFALDKGGLSGYITKATNPVAADGTWHHYVITRSGPGAGNTLIYVDGVEGHTDSQPATGLADTSSVLEFGREGSINTIGGALDEPALYKTVLSPAQVAAHYAARTVAAIADTTAPTTPAGLGATAAGPNRVNLAWTASTDNVGIVRYTVSRGGTVLSQVSGTTTTFSDLSAAPSTTYPYTVTASDAAGNSSTASSAANATTPAATTYPVAVVADGPSAYWRLGEASGAFVDSMTGNDASAVGNPTRDVANPSLATDDGSIGTTSVSKYASVADGTDVDLGDTFSIEFWATRDAQSGAFQVALSKGTGAYNVGVADGLGSSLDDKLFLGKPGSAILFRSSGDVPSDGSWHHYAVTRNGTGAGNTHVYVDGADVTVAVDTSTALADNANALHLGHDQDPGNTAPWNGKLDEVALSKSVLSAAQVAAHYAARTATGAGADTTAPTTPTGLAASAAGPNRVNLAWTASTDAVGVQGYRIYRGGSLVATTASVTFADTGLAASTLYSYTVAAIDGAGNASTQTGAQSATTTAPTGDTTAPTTPTGLTATAVGSTAVELGWSASTDAIGVQGYVIARDGSDMATVGSTAWTDTGRAPGTTYSYTVRAVDPSGNLSAASSTATATTAGSSTTTTSTYDANGNRLTASDGTLTITATYDRLNRPLTVDDDGIAGADTAYTYSLTSPSWTDPTGTYLVTLDAFDRPTSVDGPAVAAFTTAYGADGQPSSISAPNGNTTAFAYDALGRETGRATTAAGPVTRATYSLAYNRAGQVLKETSSITGDPTNGDTTYAYDPLERLASWTPPTGSPQTYGWDEVPNRTSVQVGAASPVTTTFDAANRPTTDSAGGTYASDPDGRLTARPGQRLAWDGLGRLAAVRPATGYAPPLATYSYDPLDRLRLVDYGGGNRVRFRYVGLTTSVAQVIDDATGAVLRNVGTGFLGERLLDWTGTGSNLRYYGTNAHHDTTWTADSTGAVSATLRYDPWGTLTSSTGSSLPDFRFQGSWFDATTSLSWVVSRWYAPSLGRFVSEDSLLGDPADPPSRHLYAYGAGEPVGRWDPEGACAMAAARDPVSFGLAGIGCVFEGVATGAKVTAGVAIFILTVPLLVTGDTIRPDTRTGIRRIARRIPLLPRTACFAIGESQRRVISFATQHSPKCSWMPTLRGRLLRLPRKAKLLLNALWIETQMIQQKHLYDLGPVGRHISSPYYRMERVYAAVYPWKTNLWGWGLSSAARYD